MHRFRGFATLLDDAVRTQEDRPRDFHSDRLRRLVVNDQVEDAGLLDGQLARLRAVQDLARILASTPKDVRVAWPITEQTARLGVLGSRKRRRDARLPRQLRDLVTLAEK